MKDWIQTYSGQKVRPLNPDPDTIHMVDICHALSLVNRFVGHTRFPISVAQHSVMVAREAFSQTNSVEVYRWGLLHDATEAYLNDMAKPVKETPNFEAYREAEDHLMWVIATKFDLAPEMPPAVKLADLRVLAAERRDAHLKHVPWALDSNAAFTPADAKVVELPWRDARNEFRLALNMAFPEHMVSWSDYT